MTARRCAAARSLRWCESVYFDALSTLCISIQFYILNQYTSVNSNLYIRDADGRRRRTPTRHARFMFLHKVDFSRKAVGRHTRCCARARARPLSGGVGLVSSEGAPETVLTGNT